MSAGGSIGVLCALIISVLLAAAGANSGGQDPQCPTAEGTDELSSLMQTRTLRDDFCQGKTPGLHAAPRNHPNNTDCRGYYNCFHGNEDMILCSPPTRFDETIKNCNWPEHVLCPSQPVTTQPPTQPPTTQPVTTQPPTEPPTSQPVTTEPPTEPPTSQPVTTQPPTHPPTTQPPNDDCRSGPWSEWSECDCQTATRTRSANAQGVSSSSTYSIRETAVCSCNSLARVFVGYFSNWFQWWAAPYTFLPENIQADKITHLNYAFAMVHSQTFQLRHFEDNDHDFYRRVNQNLKSQYPHLKTLISVGGWSFNLPKDEYPENAQKMMRGDPNWDEFVFSNMVSSAENRQKFVTGSIEFCRTWGFDGLDLDWEYPGYIGRGGRASDKANFALLLQDLRSAFDSEGSGSQPLLLTAAVGVGPGTASNAYDVPALNQNLDFINLMTYDMYGPWDATTTGIHSQLHAGDGDSFGDDDVPLSGSWAVDWWIDQGALPEKLTLGLATYSRGFKLKTSQMGQGPGAEVVGAAPAVRPGDQCCSMEGTGAYYELKILLDRGAQPTFDPHRCGAYLQLDDVWHGYDDENTMRCKAAYIREKGLRGAILWDLPEDDFNNGSPLVTAFSQALNED